MFELFVLAAHSLVDVTGKDLDQRIHDIWRGSRSDFVLFGLVWVITGAVLAQQTSKTIFARGSTKRRVWYGAWRGVTAGLVATGMVLILLAVLRVIGAVRMILTDDSRWHGLLKNTPLVSLPARALDYRLDRITSFGHPIPLGWIVLVVAAILMAVSGWKSGNWKPFAFLVAGTSIILVLPVADRNLWKLTGEVFLAWFLPGVVLGETGAWLTSETTFFKKTVHEFWPLAALSIALIVCTCTTPMLLGLANTGGLLGDLNRVAPERSFSTVILGKAIKPAKDFTNSRPVMSKDETLDAILWQLCITGSLSFWVMVVLLIGHSVWEIQERARLRPDGT
jgi:hypothetical protein